MAKPPESPDPTRTTDEAEVTDPPEVEGPARGTDELTTQAAAPDLVLLRVPFVTADTELHLVTVGPRPPSGGPNAATGPGAATASGPGSGAGSGAVSGPATNLAASLAAGLAASPIASPIASPVASPAARTGSGSAAAPDGGLTHTLAVLDPDEVGRTALGHAVVSSELPAAAVSAASGARAAPVAGSIPSGLPAEPAADPLRMPAPEAPSVVTDEHPDRYALLEERGRGGQARVLLALDRHIGRSVAWKELLPGADPGHGASATGARRGSGPSGGPRGASGGSAAPTSRAVQRFLREARVTGQLEHPGIVPVYELGRRADGRHYYTMRLVRGQTLAAALAACAQAAPAQRLAARLKLLGHFVDLCHAVAYAHSRGVLHRDIKPDNVMVGPFGETVLLDWGLARLHGQPEPDGPEPPLPAPSAPAASRSGSPQGASGQGNAGQGNAGQGNAGQGNAGQGNAGQGNAGQGNAGQGNAGHDRSARPERLHAVGGAPTLDGATLGTPAYMSPEQALGQRDLDDRADVWSLGTVLYEILAGVPAFSGSSAVAIATKVCLEDVPPLRGHCPQAPPELAAVAHRALSREREARYPSAAALVADVEAFMTGARVAAYRYTIWALLRRFAAQHRAALLASGLAFTAIVAALAFTAYAWRAETGARERETSARHREHTERLRAHGHLAQALARQAETLAESRATLSSRVYAAASLLHNPVHRGSPHYDPEFAAQADALQPWRVRADSLLRQTMYRPVDRLAHRWRHGEVVAAVAFSPDGRQLASADFAGWLVLRDPKNGSEIKRVRASERSLAALAFSADGTRLATGGDDGQVRLWLPGEARPRATLEGGGGAVTAVALAPDGSAVASATLGDGVVRIFDAATGAQRLALEPHKARIEGLAWSADGATLASSSWDHEVRLYRADTGARLHTLKLPEAGYRVAFSPDGKRLLAACYDKRLYLLTVATGTLERRLDGHRAAVGGATWSTDGQRLASSSFDGEVRIWSAEGGRLLQTLQAHRDTAVSVAFSPDGRWLASSSIDHTAALWALRGPDPRPRALHGSWIYAARTSADGTRAVTGGWDGQIHVHDLARGARLRRVPAGGAIQPVTIAPDGRWVATAGDAHAIQVVAVDTGAVLHTFAGHTAGLVELAVSRDGQWLASASRDGTTRLWSLTDGRAGPVIANDEAGAWHHALAFSPDGQRLGTGSTDQKVRLHDAATGAVTATLTGHADWVSGLAFAPDGRHLATSGKDRQVILWRAADGAEVRRFAGHTQWANRVAFSPDGRLVASAGDDRQAWVWEVATGAAVQRIVGYDAFTDLSFGPDGRSLGVTEGGTLTFHPVSPDPLIRPADVAQTEAEGQAGLRLDGFDLAPLE